MKDMQAELSPQPRAGGENGQAYRAYLEGALAITSRTTAVAYYAMPLPSPVDDALAEIASAFSAWSPHLREQFQEALDTRRRGLFGIFGHRAATLAVRRNDPDLLRLGLIGSAIANYEISPNRKVDTALAIFHHCARKLELEPRELFEDVARLAADEIARYLRTFGRREDVALKQYGWREIRTTDGIRFQFEW